MLCILVVTGCTSPRYPNPPTPAPCTTEVRVLLQRTPEELSLLLAHVSREQSLNEVEDSVDMSYKSSDRRLWLYVSHQNLVAENQYLIVVMEEPGRHSERGEALVAALLKELRGSKAVSEVTLVKDGRRTR